MATGKTVKKKVKKEEKKPEISILGNAKRQVKLTEYPDGRCVVDVSKNGGKWLPLGEFQVKEI